MNAQAKRLAMVMAMGLTAQQRLVLETLRSQEISEGVRHVLGFSLSSMEGLTKRKLIEMVTRTGPLGARGVTAYNWRKWKLTPTGAGVARYLAEK